MKQADYDDRLDRLTRVALKKGAKVEVRKGYASIYTDQGEWEEAVGVSGPEEVTYKEIPEELREGIALLFLGYMKEHVKPFCDELYEAGQKEEEEKVPAPVSPQVAKISKSPLPEQDGSINY